MNERSRAVLTYVCQQSRALEEARTRAMLQNFSYDVSFDLNALDYQGPKVGRRNDRSAILRAFGFLVDSRDGSKISEVIPGRWVVLFVLSSVV